MPRNGLDSTKHKRNDLVLILVLLCAALFCFLFMKMNAKQGSVAVVTVDGEVINELSLSEDTTQKVTVGDHYNILSIKDGAVTMQEADCPDKICVNHKAISKDGETIVCLPHKVVITIENPEDGSEQEKTEDSFDAVSK